MRPRRFRMGSSHDREAVVGSGASVTRRVSASDQGPGAPSATQRQRSAWRPPPRSDVIQTVAVIPSAAHCSSVPEAPVALSYSMARERSYDGSDTPGQRCARPSPLSVHAKVVAAEAGTAPAAAHTRRTDKTKPSVFMNPDGERRMKVLVIMKPYMPF